jgi:hypothetical protein
MFDDLKEEKQKEILEAFKVKDKKEMNWDIFPITTIEFEEE